MKKPWLILANPASGGGLVEKKMPVVQASLDRHSIDYTLRLSSQPKELTAIVRQAIEIEGYDSIAGIGGDGTMNEIVNGIFQQQTLPASDIRFTMLPLGTGNDWAKAHGLTSDNEAFCIRLLRGVGFMQDIGVVHFMNDYENTFHYFANAGGLGYDAFVVQSVETQKTFFFGKKIAYLGHIIKCLWLYSPNRVILRFNNHVVENFFYTINVGINKTSGGGMQITPHAVNNDGLIALTLIRDLPKWKVLLHTPKLYLGTIGLVKRYVSLHQTEVITIQSPDQPIRVETDGEILGTTPLTISIKPKALKVIIDN